MTVQKFRAFIPKSELGEAYIKYLENLERWEVYLDGSFGISGIDRHESWGPNSGAFLMRFIGLYDKDNNEIYVGDILRLGRFAFNDTSLYGEDPWKNMPENEWNNISTTLEIIKVDDDIEQLYFLKKFISGNPDVDGCEIIGNAYQNPELIKTCASGVLWGRYGR